MSNSLTGGAAARPAHRPALRFPSPELRDAPRETEERTRDRVLSAVLEHGPISAAELGDLLGLTPAAVRRHLDALETEGLIEVKLVRRAGSGAGRPARRYVISRQGQTELGNDYLDIARTALGTLAAVAGTDAVEGFARERFAAMEERFRPLIEAAGPGVEDRAQVLAEELSADGYVGSATVIGRNSPNASMLSVQLCQGHCPVQELAKDFPVFCDAETEVFSRLLGVDVRRLSTLASGGHVCTTHIPVGRTSPARLPDAVPDMSIDQQERP